MNPAFSVGGYTVVAVLLLLPLLVGLIRRMRGRDGTAGAFGGPAVPADESSPEHGPVRGGAPPPERGDVMAIVVGWMPKPEREAARSTRSDQRPARAASGSCCRSEARTYGRRSGRTSSRAPLRGAGLSPRPAGCCARGSATRAATSSSAWFGRMVAGPASMTDSAVAEGHPRERHGAASRATCRRRTGRVRSRAASPRPGPGPAPRARRAAPSPRPCA